MYYLPLISIICPLYNKRDYIKETIDSVINQTYTNWEMIIVDDGSTDGSYELVEDTYKSNDGIKLYHRNDFKQNKGGSVCRNIGIKLAKGTFILFLDADDLLTEKCLENRVKMQRRFPDQDLYVLPVLYFKNDIANNEKDRGWNWLDKVQYNCSRDKKSYFVKRFLKYHLPWTISNVLWKRETLTNLGGFDENFQRLQDPEIHTKALLQKKIKIKSFLFSQPADVHIRLDEQRHIHSMGSLKDKYLAYVSSSEQFVAKFKAMLQEQNKIYIKYLSVQLMMVETSINNAIAISKPSDFAFYLELKNEISKFRKEHDIQFSHLTQSLINLHGKFIKRAIFRKIKVPALVNLFLIYFGHYLR